MFIDNGLSFATQQSLSGTSAQNSTNVFDAGSAKKLFGGAVGRGPRVACAVTAVGGTSPTLKAQLVGADDSGLSTNVIVLAEEESNRVLTSGDCPWAFDLSPNQQLDAKRYYGVIWTQGGTSPTATANANLVMDSQTDVTGIGP